MLKKDRVSFILRKLNALYEETPIPLNHKNNFELLVAVLLSAQCTDERVNQVTPHLFKLADNSFEMRTIPIETIYNIIRPCGLAPQKSKAIHNLSSILVKKYDGKVPKDIKALETLPGVGHKTASVVVAQAFGKPSFPVDTHIFRLSQRWGLTRGKTVKIAERDLKVVFPKARWNELHLQIIFYGREFCTARGCDGRVCEICRYCYPNRKKPYTTYKA